MRWREEIFSGFRTERDVLMKISARNQLAAAVSGITEGEINGLVGLRLLDGQHLTANISMKAIEWMQLKEDKPVYAVIKATEVMIAAERVKISARNQLEGKIADLREGAVNGMVLVDIGSGQQISSTISMESIRELGLHTGMDVFAVFKATSVMIGLELDSISFGLM